jgi:hypothetical protein
VDVSGSVGGMENYWSTVSDIFTLYGPDIDAFYLWDTRLYPIDRKGLEKAIQTQDGRGGTDPHVVAEECKNKNLKNIILVTDGEVPDRSVKKCDELLANHQFEKTICYIISTNHWGREELNMSVTCAFTRNCEHKVFVKHPKKNLEAVAQFTKEDYKILSTLDTITLENF